MEEHCTALDHKASIQVKRCVNAGGGCAAHLVTIGQVGPWGWADYDRGDVQTTCVFVKLLMVNECLVVIGVMV